jgi:hypothetical protein
MSIYRELVASSRSQAVARSRELGLLEGLPGLSPHLGVGTRSGARWTGALRRSERYGPGPALAAVNAVAIDETGAVLEPASTEVEMGDLNYADATAGRWARAGLIRRPGGSDA